MRVTRRFRSSVACRTEGKWRNWQVPARSNFVQHKAFQLQMAGRKADWQLPAGLQEEGNLPQVLSFQYLKEDAPSKFLPVPI